MVPTEPESNLTLLISVICLYSYKLDISDDNQRQQQKQIANKMLIQTDVHKKFYLSSYKNFYFALISKEVKRQYPKLVGLVFDYVIGNGSSFNFSSLSLEDEAEIFSRML